MTTKTFTFGADLKGRSAQDATVCLTAEAAEVFIAAGAAPGEDARPRFRITGYSGGMMRKHPWGDIVIDLDGIKVAKQRGPVLLDHQTDSRVGFSESVNLSHADGVVVDGLFLKSTPAAKQVLEESREGYPWQASVKVELAAPAQRIAPGTKVRVNSRDFEFPEGGHVFRNTRLREVSFVTLGADELTSAEAFSFVNAPTEPAMAEKQVEPAVAAPPALTLARLKADHPDLYSEAFAAGVSAERGRVTEIFNAAPDVARELALKVVKDGDSIVESLKLFLQDGRRLKAERLSLIKENADEPVGTGKDTQTKTFATPQEKFAAEFAAMPQALQKEYGDVESYVAFQQAKSIGAVSMVGREA